jgi:dihydrofolate synthase/folylpolyglutamate synthase
MTYQEALTYLESFINYEKKEGYDYKRSFKLERMEALARAMGDPQLAVRSVHIAGSKGKGSTAAITHSILKNAGFNSGLYTSPHLGSFRERIRINDAYISEDDVARLTEKIRPVIGKMDKMRPSFFEVYTLLACLYFAENRIDFAVYETGLGGRLDATNVVRPLVSAITPISYEHTDKLGYTLGEIAFEKAGIIKDGSVCVSARQEKEAFETISKVCAERRAKLITVGRDITFEEISSGDDGSVFDVSGISEKYNMLECSLLGTHQIANAALSIGIIESMGSSGVHIPEDAVRKGIKNAVWPGRLEVMSRNPTVVLDGAQNRASARALAESVKKIFRYDKLKLVMGVSRDKDIKGIIEELEPISDSIVLTKSRVSERAEDPKKIASLMGACRESIATESVDEAMDLALSSASNNDLVLVTGSLFVVGEARERYAKIV